LFFNLGTGHKVTEHKHTLAAQRKSIDTKRFVIALGLGQQDDRHFLNTVVHKLVTPDTILAPE